MHPIYNYTMSKILLKGLSSSKSSKFAGQTSIKKININISWKDLLKLFEGSLIFNFAKVQSFIKQCLHDLHFMKTWYFSPNLSKLAPADISWSTLFS